MSINGKQGGDIANIALTYIESLTTRFENAERHINTDIQQIEKRLQQLMDLMKTVSMMEQQVTAQQEALGNMRTSMKKNLEHLDGIMNEVDAKYCSHFGVMNKKISEALLDRQDGHKKITERVSKIEERAHTWLNRAIGGWGVIVLLFGILQYIAVGYLQDAQAEQAKLDATLTKLTTRLSDMELQRTDITPIPLEEATPDATTGAEPERKIEW